MNSGGLGGIARHKRGSTTKAGYARSKTCQRSCWLDRRARKVKLRDALNPTREHMRASRANHGAKEHCTRTHHGLIQRRIVEQGFLPRDSSFSCSGSRYQITRKHRKPQPVRKRRSKGETKLHVTQTRVKNTGILPQLDQLR